MISAVILAKNEEKNIKDCLESLAWCDERIVIDDGSSDKTVDIAKKFGALVFERALDGNFSAQRNFGLEKANGDWVLFVDADERISHSLSYEISHLINESLDGCVGFLIPRTDVMWGKELHHGETGGMKLLRLAKKSAGTWAGDVHERWNVKGKIGVVKHQLMHYPHQKLSEFLSEINMYTSLRAKELHKRKVKVTKLAIIAYPAGKFLKNFFILRGFQDGIPGLISAVLMSLHSFLVRGKLYLYEA